MSLYAYIYIYILFTNKSVHGICTGFHLLYFVRRGLRLRRLQGCACGGPRAASVTSAGSRGAGGLEDEAAGGRQRTSMCDGPNDPSQCVRTRQMKPTADERGGAREARVRARRAERRRADAGVAGCNERDQHVWTLRPSPKATRNLREPRHEQ